MTTKKKAATKAPAKKAAAKKTAVRKKKAAKKAPPKRPPKKGDPVTRHNYREMVEMGLLPECPDELKWWNVRSSYGRNPIFESPEQLWDACTQYFEWIAKTPLESQIIHQGKEQASTKKHMRAMTLAGLRIFLGISEQTWFNYKMRDEFLGVIEHVEQIIRNQKIEGAAAGMLKENIIARELQLHDTT